LSEVAIEQGERCKRVRRTTRLASVATYSPLTTVVHGWRRNASSHSRSTITASSNPAAQVATHSPTWTAVRWRRRQTRSQPIVLSGADSSALNLLIGFSSKAVNILGGKGRILWYNVIRSHFYVSPPFLFDLFWFSRLCFSFDMETILSDNHFNVSYYFFHNN